jgi:hypothetical protein
MSSPVVNPPPQVDEWIVRLFGNNKPLGFQAGDENLYRYVKNATTDETDPSGLLSSEIQQPLPLPPGPVAEESLAVDALKNQIKEWRNKSWHFAANLLQYFIDKKGPARYIPTGSDIQEVACDSRLVIQTLIAGAQFSSFRPRPPGVLAGTGLGLLGTPQGAGSLLAASALAPLAARADTFEIKGHCGIYETAGIEIGARSRLGAYMTTTYGGFDYDIKGDVTNLNADKTRGTVDALVKLDDNYTFPPGFLNYRLVFPAYKAAYLLEDKYGYKSFLHTLTFSYTYTDVPVHWQ